MKKHLLFSKVRRALALVPAAVLCLAGIAGLGAVRASAADEQSVTIDENSFPDEAFRNRVSVYADADGDGVLTPEEIEKTQIIELDDAGIKDLSGIQYLIFLEHLSCAGNSLTSVDLSKNTELEDLYIEGNKLRVLELGENEKLVNLNCSDNEIHTLDVSGCPALETLYCSSNDLTELNLSNNPLLTELICSDNYLTGLDVSGCSLLEMLECVGNNIDNLYVYEGITGEQLSGFLFDPATNLIYGSPEAETEDETFFAGKGKYAVLSEKKRTVILLGVRSKKIKKLIIPSKVTYNGVSYKVTSIGRRALANTPKLKKVVIGKNVKKIKKSAFFKCVNLKKIVVKSTKLKSIGHKAIKKINKKAVINVPNKMLKKYKRLFASGTGFIKSMTIR